MKIVLLCGVTLLAIAAFISAWAQPIDPPLVTGLDADPTGNTATAVAKLSACRQVSAGETFEVDFYALDVPPPDGEMGGIVGFSYNLLFDPHVVQVTAANNGFLIAALGEPQAIGIIDGDATAGENDDALPGTTGNVRVDFIDLSSFIESGSGVLSRITLRAVADGRTDLRLIDRASDAPLVLSSAAALQDGSGVYPIASVQNAVIAVGQPCAAAPTPHVPDNPPATTAPPTNGSQPTGATSSGQPATGSGQPSATNPRSGSSTPTSNSTGDATSTPTAGEADDDGNFPWLVALIGAVLLGGGVAAYVYFRRRAIG